MRLADSEHIAYVIANEVLLSVHQFLLLLFCCRQLSLIDAFRVPSIWIDFFFAIFLKTISSVHMQNDHRFVTEYEWKWMWMMMKRKITTKSDRIVRQRFFVCPWHVWVCVLWNDVRERNDRMSMSVQCRECTQCTCAHSTVHSGYYVVLVLHLIVWKDALADDQWEETISSFNFFPKSVRTRQTKN